MITGTEGLLEQGTLLFDRETLESWLFCRRPQLTEALLAVVQEGGKASLPESIRITSMIRINGYSGFEYTMDDLLYARVGFAPLLYGGFVINKVLSDGSSRREVWEIFSESGQLLAVEGSMDKTVLYVDMTEMEPSCPILSHLYNYLAHEYGQAQTGISRSRQVHLVETFLRKLAKESDTPLSVHGAASDPAVTQMARKIVELENDPVLTWEERQKALAGLYAERKKIIDTKKRAHRLGWLGYSLPLQIEKHRTIAARIKARPSSNARGFSYKYTIGMAIWFLQTVRGNIGYSIALAIYGPFTFYFITQPLNPHAMWAVGKARASYLEFEQQVKSALGVEALPAVTAATATGAVVAGATETKQEAPKEDPNTKFASYKPSHLDLLLSTDVPSVDKQNWSDRMSNFKDMQIGYEENMVFAARMGRIEQMETQLNFPLIVETSWQELERYMDEVRRHQQASPQSGDRSAELKAYLGRELLRTERLQLYMWDRLQRYILDHPYTVMDQGKEQVYRDYYMGHAFLLFREMTSKLSKRFEGFKKPAEYKRIEKLAQSFEKTRKEGDSVLARLKNNSALFAQKDRLDGRELRSYLKRQWEVLYLLQNKAQEASNFGLMSYTWSVRNAIWLIQGMYSAKRRELSLLLDPKGRTAAEISAEIKGSIEPLFESSFHLMNLEFVSIRPELSERLTKDIEFQQRQTVITTIEESLKDREKALKAL